MQVDTKDVLLAIQRALVGEVFPRLHTIHVAVQGNAITLHWGLTEAPDDEDCESMSEVEGEVLADLSPDVSIESILCVRRVDEYSAKKPSGICVFKRR